MIRSLLEKIQTDLKSELEHDRVYIGIPKEEAGKNPELYIYPVGFFATPVKLRQSDSTYTICVAVEQTCVNEAALISFWEYMDDIYAFFTKLGDHYILTDDGDYIFLSVNSRYYNTPTSDVAQAEITIDAKLFNQ